MIIIGVDFHPEFQQIASLDTDTGEFQEKRLVHPEEAEQFYRLWRPWVRRYVWVWRPVDTHLSDCWQNCRSSSSRLRRSAKTTSPNRLRIVPYMMRLAQARSVVRRERRRIEEGRMSVQRRSPFFWGQDEEFWSRGEEELKRRTLIAS
jgi:hypothetical protein